MIDPAILDTALRQLRENATLPEAEFWRAYASVEDAALYCTEPHDHGVMMEALNACLLQLGRIHTVSPGA
jgi:hypothetical protein